MLPTFMRSVIGLPLFKVFLLCAESGPGARASRDADGEAGSSGIGAVLLAISRRHRRSSVQQQTARGNTRTGWSVLRA